MRYNLIKAYSFLIPRVLYRLERKNQLILYEFRITFPQLFCTTIMTNLALGQHLVQHELCRAI